MHPVFKISELVQQSRIDGKKAEAFFGGKERIEVVDESVDFAHLRLVVVHARDELCDVRLEGVLEAVDHALEVDFGVLRDELAAFAEFLDLEVEVLHLLAQHCRLALERDLDVPLQRQLPARVGVVESLDDMARCVVRAFDRALFADELVAGDAEEAEAHLVDQAAGGLRFGWLHRWRSVQRVGTEDSASGLPSAA